MPGAAAHIGPTDEPMWYCSECDCYLFDTQVRHYRSRDGVFASCLSCGERCESMQPGAMLADARGAAVESEEDRQRRLRRDYVLGPVIFGVALGIALAAESSVAGRLYLSLLAGSLLRWIVIGTAAMVAAWWVMHRIISAPFDEPGVTMVKLAALNAAAYAVRATALAIFAPHVAIGGYAAIGGALYAVSLVGLAVIVLPLLVLLGLLNRLFELSAFEWFGCAAGLVITQVMLFAAVSFIAP